METETIDRRPRPAHGSAGIAVDFNFDERALPGADEIALVLGILPDIIEDLLAAPAAAEEH